MTVCSVSTVDLDSQVLLTTMVIIHAAVYYVSALPCRFASTSASQEKCVFPCRCTDGCDTTIGDCLNGGRCEDGYPSGYRWSGRGCQTGNVAYLKNASQSSYMRWSKQFPAGRAVDGNTDSKMSNGHCAHPDTKKGRTAWWMVDLGGTYNISTVIIYNRIHRPDRLNMFILSVGDSSNRTRHAECARHNRSVAAGAIVNETCTTIGRYLSFRSQENIAGLCEVIVIGHKHIPCQQCPSTSDCNDVTGCDACASGKQQPDCEKDCDHGTYGRNCEEECGHCKDNRPCDVKNGHCTAGCESWYTPDVCKAYIPTSSAGSGLATGSVVGIASATFVLGLFVATAALLFILRKRLNKPNTNRGEQERPQSSIELDADAIYNDDEYEPMTAVEDENEYEPTTSVEDENEYEPTTSVPVRDDYVNVNIYDVIQN